MRRVCTWNGSLTLNMHGQFCDLKNRECSHEGLIKTYHKPFSPDNHDALNENDYVMVHYVGEQIEPLPK